MSTSHGDGGTIERICDLVSHPTRRVLLRVLRDIETPTTIETVAGEIIDADGNRPDGVEQTEKADRVVVELYHIHLPKMADTGMINYDPETGTIRTNDTIDVAYNVLDTVSGRDDF